MGRKYSTGSSPLNSFPSMILTYLLFSMAPLAIAPLLTNPLPLPLSPYLAPGRCLRTWVLITYQFYSVPLFPIFRRRECPPSFNFQKARRDDFAFYFDSHCPSAEEYASLSLSSAATLFTALLQMRPNLPFLSASSNAILKPGCPLKLKKQSVKDVRLSLPLKEAMKIVRLTSPLPICLVCHR